MEVIFENQNIIAVNKPAGMLTHPTPARREEGVTVAHAISEEFPEVRNVGDRPDLRPGVVHRLDRDTSGILLVARNQPTFEWLKRSFQEHRVKKGYLALVRGDVSRAGIIEKPIGLRPGTTRRSVNARRMKMVKKAVTRYRPLEGFSHSGESYTLLAVSPETGRTHQIRVHLASIGHPIVGDVFYGGKKEKQRKGGRLMLHAASIEFSLPKEGQMRLEAEPPDDFRKVLKSVGGSYVPFQLGVDAG